MGIFRRGTKNDTKHSSAGLHPDTTVSDVDVTGAQDTAETTGATSDPAPATSRGGGPFDRSEVEGLAGRLDLGSLWLAGVPGMELRLEVEEETQNVVGVTVVLGGSAVQLQAFAAPRNEGIWDDIRTEIAAGITSQGGTADKMSGPLGAELRAQMPAPGPDGRTVFSPVRFVGVDGPRWFLRAVLSGAAAVDDSVASNLLDVVRSTVVVRGDDAMAPRELLPLKLPNQPDDGSVAAGDMGADGSSDNGSAAGKPVQGGHPSLDDFKPFERGPEITEIH